MSIVLKTDPKVIARLLAAKWPEGLQKNLIETAAYAHAMQMAIEDIHGEYPLAGPLLEQLKQRAAANLARLMGEGK